jgi:dCTP deaminase
MLSAIAIAERLSRTDAKDPLVITPCPDLDEVRQSGAASIDLRLGTWFASPRPSRIPVLDVRAEAQHPETATRLAKPAYIGLGTRYVLHPRSFVLAVTLEWVRLPHNLGGEVLGKSAWGRRGLMIATATAVHPSFSGCLTLELTNLGEIPVALYPGMLVCQLFLHEVEDPPSESESSTFVGFRKPVLGTAKWDRVAELLYRDQSNITSTTGTALPMVR